MNKKTENKTQEIPAEVIGALADAFGKSFLTIQRWIASNDDRLTSDKAKQVFARKNVSVAQLNSAA